MAMTSDSIPSTPQPKKPEAQLPKPEIVDGKAVQYKPTIHQKLIDSGVPCAMFKNNTIEAVSVQLRKTFGLHPQEIIWLNPGEQCRLPIADVFSTHGLSQIKEK